MLCDKVKNNTINVNNKIKVKTLQQKLIDMYIYTLVTHTIYLTKQEINQ